MSLKRVVAITGCDSGLGWAIASRTAREGLVTVAGMHAGVETEAARALKDVSAHPYELDVTKPESVNGFKKYIDKLLIDNPSYHFFGYGFKVHLMENQPQLPLPLGIHAVVNNAGVMVMGDYEWQTPEMIESAVNVNLLGAMRVISAFLPDLRRSALPGGPKPRIINVSSHCGLEPLPVLAPYSASKAGLLALTRSLRLELRSHGLATAVAFVPGGFIGASNLMASQSHNFNAMRANFDMEQKSFQGKRITSLEEYLGKAAFDSSYDSLKDEAIIGTFMKALTDPDPKEMYKVESLRYTFYYTLLKLPLPENVRYWLFKRFLNFPHL